MLLRRSACFFFLLLGCAVTVQANETSLPFWRAKEKFYDRIKEGEILVSVQRVDVPKGKNNTLKITGGGWVRAPREFVYQYAQDFEMVAKFSGFVDQVTYDKKNHLLKAHISAFGHQANLEFAVEVKPEREPQVILFTLQKGPLQGLTAQITFAAVEKMGSKTSEVGITGEYRYDEFPIPRFFLQFGLEVVFQKMAAHLREKAEAAFSRKVANL